MRTSFLLLAAVCAGFLALGTSGCVVECTAASCGAGAFCGSDGLCHTSTSGCATTGCPAGQLCEADGLCHVAGAAPTYSSCGGGITCASTVDSCTTVATPETTGGSFCTSTCATSSTCPGSAAGLGAACLMLAAAPGSPFLCYAGCGSDADCAVGTVCVAVTGGAVGHVCMPGSHTSSGQPTYAACGGGLSCASPVDSCLTVDTPMTTGGSFCTSSCTTSAACPGASSPLGAACLMLAAAPGSPFLCYPGCSSGADCDVGTSCIAVTGGAVGHVCMPGNPAVAGALDYDHCVSSSDCISGQCAYTTVTTTTGGSLNGYQCTEACSTSAACPDRNGMGAACLMIAGTASAFYCYQGCTFDSDCPGSGVCTPVTGGAVGSVCFPNG